MVDVFRYLDVCAYLAAEYEHRKSRGRGFSYRAFSRKAGLRSPNHMKRVIDGERTLTPAMAARYANALGLEGDAQRYFLDLAAFGRATTSRQRESAYQRLLGYRRVRTAHRLEAAQADYHCRWYLPALRELVSLETDQDPQTLAAKLVPPIAVADAREGLKTLATLGLITRDDDGRWVQAQNVVTTGAETRGLHVATFHRAMMERAADSIDLVDPEQRDISSLTFTCSAETYAEVKRRIVAFRQELIALLSDDADEDRVAELNIQLFPLSTGNES